MSDTALCTPAEINGAAQDLAGAAGQYTGSVHLAQGVFGGVHRDIVVVQHGIPAAEVNGIQIILGFCMVQHGAGAAGGNAAAQLHTHLLHLCAGAFFHGNGIPAACAGT